MPMCPSITLTNPRIIRQVDVIAAKLGVRKRTEAVGLAIDEEYRRLVAPTPSPSVDVPVSGVLPRAETCKPTETTGQVPADQ